MFVETKREGEAVVDLGALRVDRLLMLADEIEKPKIGLGFHMGNIREETSCGTVCCIAGHINAMFGSQSIWEAAEAIGMLGSSKGLFVPPGWNDDAAVVAGKYPRARAARVLRHLAATGVVDWTIA